MNDEHPCRHDEWLQCPRCNYDLVGLPERRCPECGTAFDPDALYRRNVRAMRISLINKYLWMSIAACFACAYVSCPLSFAYDAAARRRSGAALLGLADETLHALLTAWIPTTLYINISYLLVRSFHHAMRRVPHRSRQVLDTIILAAVLAAGGFLVNGCARVVARL